jgi:hypothetical protein
VRFLFECLRPVRAGSSLCFVFRIGISDVFRDAEGENSPYLVPRWRSTTAPVLLFQRAPDAIDPPINPQRTDKAGHYGWDVIRGCWYVKVEAPGYFTKFSAVAGVPPEVTDLDIASEPWKRVYLPVVLR